MALPRITLWTLIFKRTKVSIEIVLWSRTLQMMISIWAIASRKYQCWWKSSKIISMMLSTRHRGCSIPPILIIGEGRLRHLGTIYKIILCTLTRASSLITKVGVSGSGRRPLGTQGIEIRNKSWLTFLWRMVRLMVMAHYEQFKKN